MFLVGGIGIGVIVMGMVGVVVDSNFVNSGWDVICNCNVIGK